MARRTVGRIPDKKELLNYGNAAQEIAKQISRELLSVDLLDYKAIKEMQIRDNISALVKKLNKLAARHGRELINNAYDEARKIAVVSLEVLGRKPVSGFDPKADANSKQKYLKEMLGFITKADSSINVTADQFLHLSKIISQQIMLLQEFGGFTPEEESTLLESISLAVEKGTSRQRVYARIRHFIQLKIGDGDLIRINDRYYNIKKYSMLVARTEMRRSQSEGVINACLKYQNDLVQVSDHGTDTEICLPYEGGTFSLSGRDNDFDALEMKPPFHPNCQHFLVPTTKEAIEFTGTDKFGRIGG